jgi:trigger factor
VTPATVKRLDPTQVEIEIPISPEQLEAARERAFRQLVRNVRIPGFRPGKAPRKLFEAQYGTEIIDEKAMDSVVPDVYMRAIREAGLEPVDHPQMELLPEEEGRPIRLRATVNVRPEIELRDYKGIELTSPPIGVDEEEVDRALDSLRRDAVTLVPVDRPVELGDVATLDYVGRIDGVPFEGGKAENQPTEISEERFIPGFASGIVGMKAGETKEVTANFPDDYSNKELAGKAAVFTVTVHDVKVPEYPEIDDEFAKRFEPEADLAKLRADLRTRLEKSAKARSRRALASVAMDRLLAAHDFALPGVMVERETESLVEEAKGYVARAGITWEQYLEQQQRTEELIRDEYKKEAERRVRSTLLLEAIAKVENIEAGKGDIEAEIGALSRQYGQPREALIEMLRPNLPSLIDGIVRSKTLDFLVDHAKVTETQPAAAEATNVPPK